MTVAQIYAGSRMPAVLTAEELEDMLDFADIGGVYDSPASAVANRTALQNFLNSRNGQPGIFLAFTGNRLSSQYNQKRQPGTAYIDLSAGPITYTPAGTEVGNLTFAGLKGSKIVGQSAASATTPIFSIQRPIGGLQSFEFSGLEFQNGNGSGVYFWGNKSTTTGPGARTSFNGCYFTNIGTSLGSPPAVDYDGWTDLSSAVYALKVVEADGCFLHECAIRGVAGHGIIAERWHEGLCHCGIRECTGSGLKADRVNSTTLSLRAESNGGYGLHIRDTGNDRYESGSLVHDNNGAANAWDVWLEANGGRGATLDATKGQGYRYRQCKVDSSSRVTMGGHSGWEVGKVYVAEPSRRSCRFIEADYIDPSPGDTYCTLQYDMNNDGSDITDNNWGTIWTDPADRPTITELGDAGDGTYEVRITVPADSYNAATGSAWWLPIPDSVTMADGAAGDTWMYTIEMSTDQFGVAYCTSRDELAVPQRMPSYLGSISIRPMSAPVNAFSLWSTSKRKFSGRVAVGDATANMGLTMYVYFSGMEDLTGTGNAYPLNQFNLNIHSLKLYRIAE